MRLRRNNIQTEHKAKRVYPISFYKLIPGIILVLVGLMFGYMYVNNDRNMFLAVLAVFTLGPGGLLSYLSYKPGESGIDFKGKTKLTGLENTIAIFAYRDKDTKLDVPVCVKFLELKHPPTGARLHYVRNFKRHFYEIINNTETPKMEPVKLKDKKSFPPELFKIPAAMQTYKDAVDYSPPTMMQKVAPGLLIATIAIVGFLMVASGG